MVMYGPKDSTNSPTTRVGARYGPEAIRSASILQRPYNTDMNIHLFKYLSGVDYGDID